MEGSYGLNLSDISPNKIYHKTERRFNNWDLEISSSIITVLPTVITHKSNRVLRGARQIVKFLEELSGEKNLAQRTERWFKTYPDADTVYKTTQRMEVRSNNDIFDHTPAYGAFVLK